MANKFFEEDQQQEDQQTEVVRVGDNEFTQEELDELIGAGRKLKEIETKQGQSIDDILRSWGKRGERLGQWKAVTGVKKPEEFTQKVESEKSKTPEQVSEEELRQKVLAEARKFGLITKEDLNPEVFMTKEEFQKWDSGRKTIAQVNKVIRSNTKKGYPTVTTDKLLEFMSDPKNPADPTNAYKLMFEKEIKEIEMNKVNALKGKPIYTNKESSAGGKQYDPPRPSNLEGLRSLLGDHLRSGNQ